MRRKNKLPWYAIIGAPGAGKTTAVLSSGVNAKPAEKLGRKAVRGVGATRSCDWWFTDRAVFIDTAGRYTTQQNDRDDRKGWEALLQLLVRERPKRPLDGILVAVSVADILGFSAAQLAEHARMLRTRLDELQRSPRVAVPVYVLLTKCDLLPGFVDWFAPLPRETRDQSWGVPLDSGAGAAAFGDSFATLVDRLADGLVGKLHAERDVQRRARIFSLPSQLHALQDPLTALVSAMGPSLRGLYLTSGTQTGTPIDRMLSAFGRELGVERQILPPNPSTGKSFFLAGLLNEIILPAAGRRGPTGRQGQRPRLLTVSIAALLVLAIAVAAWSFIDYSRSAHELARLDAEVTKATTRLASAPATADADPRPLLPALNSLRDLAHDAAGSGGKVAAAAKASYERVLTGAFQPRIASAIEMTMRTGTDKNVQYEALKAYQMLTDGKHLDRDGLKVAMISLWSRLAPPLQPNDRNDLLDHMDGLLQSGLRQANPPGSGIKLDAALLDSLRYSLSLQPPIERIALRLDLLLDSRSFADFSVASLRPPAASLFVGADGKSEPKHVPGRYTIEAYDVVTTQVPALAAQLASESEWVLGTSQAGSSGDVAFVTREYRARYTQAWARLLDDLRLKPAASSEEANNQALALGKANGPLAQLLSEIARQTPLRLQTGNEGPITIVDPAADRLVAVGDLVARTASGRAPLDGILQSLTELPTVRTTSAERVARIVADAKLAPEPVRSMVLALANGSGAAPVTFASNAVTSDSVPVTASSATVASTDTTGTTGSPAPAGTVKQQISAQVGVPCVQLVAGRFPFDRRATREASFEQFARVFGPKGAFDAASGRLRPSGGDSERFRAAAQIREVFFRRGGTRPALQLTFTPVDLDEAVDRFQLEIDGQTVRYAHGPPLPTVIKWPGRQGKVRIELTPASAGAPIELSGPWALFRLFDRAAIQDTGEPGHFRVVFDVDGHKASFDVETDSRANPFRLRELERFDCPLAGQ